MKTKVGGLDRILPALVGLVPLFTAVFRFCPAYLPIKLNTCPPKEK